MTTRDIRVLTPHETDRATSVHTIEGSGQPTGTPAPSQGQDTAVVIVVDDGVTDDPNQITAAFADRQGRALRMVRHADGSRLAAWDQPTALVVVSDDAALSYDIARRLCALTGDSGPDRRIA